MVKYFLTNSPSQTRKLGKKIAEKNLKEKPKKKVLVIGLEGELGGGKTTLLQGFARGLKIKEKILSPTFVIIKRFKIQDPRFKNFYHVDCYRIQKPKEILDLGFKEIISDPKNIIVVEWAGKIKKILPKSTTWINFEFIDKNSRKIIIKEWRKSV